MRTTNKRRQTLTMTVSPKTVESLDAFIAEVNIDGIYDVSRGRLIDFLVEEATKKDGFFQIKVRELIAK